VLKSAAAFAAHPDTAHLIGLKPGISVGECATARTVSGGADILHVDAVLVPAALEAAVQLNDSGLLSPYLNAADRALFSGASRMARVWRAQDRNCSKLSYLARRPAAPSRPMPPHRPLRRSRAWQRWAPMICAFMRSRSMPRHPIPVMHSDEGCAVIRRTGAERVDRAVTALMRPFPAG